MALGAGLRDYLFDTLAALGRIESKRFFGLDGIKAAGALIGFVRDDKFYLRTDGESRAAYVEEGGKPFTITKGGERIATSYYPVPDRLLDEPDELVKWARRAREAALEAPSAKKRRAKHERRATRGLGRKKARG